MCVYIYVYIYTHALTHIIILHDWENCEKAFLFNVKW